MVKKCLLCVSVIRPRSYKQGITKVYFQFKLEKSNFSALKLNKKRPRFGIAIGQGKWERVWIINNKKTVLRKLKKKIFLCLKFCDH